MKELHGDDLSLCRFQAQVFERSRDLTQCSSPVFLRRFMHSKAAKRMDLPGFMSESSSQETIIAEVEEEYGPSSYGTMKYSSEALYWMGYLYRYWCLQRNLTSRQVCKIIQPTELRKLYAPYHTLDPAQAIERILEAKGLPLEEEDPIAKGVRIMREVMKRRNLL